MNFNNGNVNNNNRYNQNYVRAVAALGDDWKLSWYNAYLDCIRHKLSSHDCCAFRMLRLDDVWQLMADVFSFRYQPGVSKAFCVERPKVREIFAADFRDRIVHHWIYNQLNEIFENLFEAKCNNSYNCRKGYGTLRCVQDFNDDIKYVEENNNGSPWIVKIDIRSFFMSIDRRIMWQKIKKLINEKYKGEYKEHLLHVIHATLKHSPQEKCELKGNLSLWDSLPKNKSLFNAEPLVGMPIGNLTSQQFANFYLFDFDCWLKTNVNNINGRFKRFVDDIIIVLPSKKDAKNIVKEIKQYLSARLNLSLHPDKVYMQPVYHGVSFIGTVIKSKKDKRVFYISNRTVRSFKKSVQKLERFCESVKCGYINKMNTTWSVHQILHGLRRRVDSVNAYIGLMTHNSTYAIRASTLLVSKSIMTFCNLDAHSLLIRIKYKIRTARTHKRLYTIIKQYSS